MSCLGGSMPGLKNPKGPSNFSEGLPKNSLNSFYNSLFFRNLKTKERPP